MNLLRTNFYRGGLLVPSLNLDFTSGVLNPLLSFSRASAKWVTNASGVITQVGVNEPAFDYDPLTGLCKGLLIEEQRTNLLVNSDGNSITNWGNYGGVPTVTPSTIGGVMNGYFPLRRINSSGFEGVRRNVTGLVSGSVYTVSVYVRKNPSAPATNVAINSPIGITATSLALSTALTTSWARFSLTFTATGTSGDFNFYNSTSAVGDGFDMCCFQIEQGSFPTSYIPTTSAAVTRSADVCSMSLGSWFNPNVGTILVSGRSFASANYSTRYAFLYGGDTNNQILIANSSGGVVIGQIVSGGLVRSSGGPAYAPGNNYKIAMAYGSPDGIGINGLIHNAPNSTSNPTGLTTLWLGSSNGGNAFFNGHIAYYRHYRNRLPNSLLQSLTA